MEALFEKDVPRKRLLGAVIIFVIWLAVTVIGAFVLTPSREGHGTHTQLGLPACPSVVMFDRPCPGCGLTTSWTSILHGKFGKAFVVNWMGPVLYFAFTWFALAGMWGFYKGMRIRSESKLFNNLLLPVLAAFLIYGVGRFFFGGRMYSDFAVGLDGEFAQERVREMRERTE